MNGPSTLRTALSNALRNDPRVRILSEALDLSPATRGLAAEAPDRVHLLPAADAGLVGVAIGMAMGGAVPVVELSGPDALWGAAQQLGQESVLLTGDFAAALVIRVPLAAGVAPPFAALEGMPQVQVAAGADAASCAALLTDAISGRNVVVLFESADAMAISGDGGLGLGKARVRQEGDHVSLLCLGGAVSVATEAAAVLAESGVTADVVDLGSTTPLDESCVRARIHHTGRPVLVGTPTSLLSKVVELGFLRLEAPPVAVAPRVEAIVSAALSSARY